MSQKTKFGYLLVIVLALVFGFTSIIAVAKNSGSSKSSQSKEKSKSVNLKNYAKPDKTKGETNAKLHKVKTDEVTANLEEVANDEETTGNTEVSEQIDEVAEEQEDAQDETVDAIEEVEGRGKVKTFLVGTDYKNLGQLRSGLVHNRNEIRKLTKSLSGVQTPENQALIEAQLATLMQERERIKTVITTSQDSFSLFGWVARFLTDYEATPINDQEEEQLTDEVEGAIDNATTESTETNTTETETTSTDTTAPAAPTVPTPQPAGETTSAQ